jgi:hypothetical protein
MTKQCSRRVLLPSGTGRVYTLKGEKMQDRLRNAVWAAASAAVIGLTSTLAMAGVSGGSGREFVVSTTGATALAAFSTARNTDGSVNRGPFFVGSYNYDTDSDGLNDVFRFGDSNYTINSATGQAFGIANLNSVQTPPEPTTTADRVVYMYHSTGSINGIKDLARAQGLLTADAFPVSANNQLFVMGQRQNGITGFTNGYQSYLNSGKPEPIIAYSDVRSAQAFAQTGASDFNAKPLEAGYGQGRGAINRGGVNSAANFQKLTDVGGLVGGLAESTTRLRNETLAIVPFTVSASTGTGLNSLEEADVQWLQTTGRMANGANFNFVSRDSGSGTRNQGAVNLGVDPGFAAGERDRTYLGSSVTVKDPDGNNVVVTTGMEASPEISLTSNSASAQPSNAEHRPSALVRFSDKLSGGTGVRTQIVGGRMAIGILSAGDVGSRGRTTSTATPMKVLAIDFVEDNSNGAEPSAGPVQPTAQNVTDGYYQLWSANQAITVTPDGTTLATAGSRVKGDTDDETGLSITSISPDNKGAGRKFLANLTNSVAIGPNATTFATPFDGIVQAGFIPPSVMKVQKNLDGQTQSSRTLSQTPQPGGALSEQQIYDDTVVSTTGALNKALAWAPASDMWGANTLKYRVFDVFNNSAIDSTNGDVGVGNFEIEYSRFDPSVGTGVGLAGDYNQDGVRDLADVPALAQAYADTAAYLAAHPTVTATNVVNNNGLASVSNTTLAGALTNAQAGLLVLSDLNGDGNVVVKDASGNVQNTYNADGSVNPAFVAALGGGNDEVAAISREDVRFFLYGASVDTSAYSTASEKRDMGVRLGQLKKNAAIDTFNAIVPTSMRFDKLDVDGDGDRDLLDAKIVDRNVGKNYTQLADVLSTWDDLIAAELDDNNVITAVLAGGTSDFKLIRDGLAGVLAAGDTDFNGAVNFDDLLKLAQNYQASGIDQWSDGDFDLNGAVGFDDLLALAQNYGLGTVMGTQLGEHFMSDWALAQSMVPEPTILSGLVMLAAASRRRRSV